MKSLFSECIRQLDIRHFAIEKEHDNISCDVHKHKNRKLHCVYKLKQLLKSLAAIPMRFNDKNHCKIGSVNFTMKESILTQSQ